jgi:hypothetical protein
VDKKPVFLVMDYLLTGIVISLICLAAWLIYKRWVGRYRSAPEPEEYEEIPEPSVETMVAEPIPEPETTEEN